jgi:lysophospholipase L1-like esterase
VAVLVLALGDGAGSQFPADPLALPADDSTLPGTGPINRKDWFAPHWRDLRATWRQERERDRRAIVFVGDSITEAWADLAAAFPGLKIANRGISGDTTRGVLARLPDDVLALEPSAIVLLIGTNDLELGGTPDIAAANLRLILAAVERHAQLTPVILCQVMPSAASMGRPACAVRAMNARFRDVAKAHAHVTVLDTWTLFADPNGDAPLAYFPDRLHPNAAGYARWAAALRPLLTSIAR